MSRATEILREMAGYKELVSVQRQVLRAAVELVEACETGNLAKISDAHDRLEAAAGGDV